MTAFFELFNPGARHWRQQRDIENQLFIDTKKAGSGLPPVDLDSGRITLQGPPESTEAPRPTTDSASATDAPESPALATDQDGRTEAPRPPPDGTSGAPASRRTTPTDRVQSDARTASGSCPRTPRHRPEPSDAPRTNRHRATEMPYSGT